MVGLQFSKHLESRSANENPGELFQVFVHELLSYDYPGLQVFPGGGKDGAIDLIQDNDHSRLVVECKYISKGGHVAAKKRWKDEVAENLQKHLIDPEGPTKTQSQYRPWFRTDLPIVEYLFCTSAVPANTDQVDELSQEISQFFNTLGTDHKHLSHLARIKVRVLHWNDLHDRLRKRPQLLFRWFPSTRPQGLVPVDEVPIRGTFRSYLSSDKLPYYSRKLFLQTLTSSPQADIPDEEEILNQLECENITGLVVTGSGGVGKTRFTLEIGRLARQRGWLVVRVLNRLTTHAVEQLVEMITPEARVLLLFDYIETQRNFIEIVESLGDLNDTYGLHLRYVANCRTSYYPSIAAASIHQRIDLSPVTQDLSIRELAEAFQRQTVLHILKHSAGLEISERHLEICRDIPVFAVFISYLHTTNRHPELKELLDEADFNSWVLKRVEATFSSSVIPRNLATLVALFPLPGSVVHLLGGERYRELLDKLATDGWVEKLSPDVLNQAERWEAVQDVFADSIFISFIQSIPHTVDLFISDLLSLAAKINCLRSALVSLERVKDQPLIESLDWLAIFKTQIAENRPAWRSVRDLLTRIPLLTNLQVIDLLADNDEIWSDVEIELGFQYSLGFVARWAKDQPEGTVSPGSMQGLNSWLKKSASRVTVSNYVITSGLLFSREIVRDEALNWIVAQPENFQTHYLLRAWIKQGLPLEDITFAVKRWLSKFAHIDQYSFIAPAWLDADGEIELIRETLPKWLVLFKTSYNAQFVYTAWLNAGGEEELVKGSIEDWLLDHKMLPEAEYLYAAWLDAKCDLKFVEGPIKEWLRQHKTLPEAHFVYEAWLKAGGDLGFIQDDIREWLDKNQSSTHAGYVYKAWLNAGGDLKFVESVIKEWLDKHKTLETAYVYKAWLAAGGKKDVVQASVTAWLDEHKTLLKADLVYDSWLASGGDKEVVQESIAQWLSLHKLNVDAGYLFKAWINAKGDISFIKHALSEWIAVHKVSAVAGLLYEALLDIGYDLNFVRPLLIDWLNVHGSEMNADFIYAAWRQAGGQFSEVADNAFRWLHENNDKAEAVFLLKDISRLESIPTETVRDILTWCRTFPQDEDVLWRLTPLRTRLFDFALADDVCRTAEVVFEYLTKQEELSEEQAGQITMLLSYLIAAPNLREGLYRERVDKLLLNWIRNPFSFAENPKPPASIQRVNYVQRVVNLIKFGALSSSEDLEAIKRFLLWVNNWDLQWKTGLRRTLDFLKHNYPPPELWDTVITGPDQDTQLTPPNDLIEACANGNCVLFVGSGLSARAGLPAWQTLIRDLFSWSVRNKLIDETEAVNEISIEEDVNLICQKISSVLQEDKNALLSYLETQDFQNKVPSGSHRILCEIGFSAIITSNFDNLLEQTLERRQPPAYIPHDADLLLRSIRNNQFFILKLSGQLENPESLLITPVQLRNLIERIPSFSTFIAELFGSRTIFFVGTSVQGLETDLEMLGSFDTQRTHYALVSNENLDEETVASIKNRYNTILLPYPASPTHNQVRQFIGQLAKSVQTALGSKIRKYVADSLVSLRKMSLENIGPFDHLEIELTPTWNILFGDNGVGKSFILKAIALVICGQDGYSYARNLIKAGQKRALITLETNEEIYEAEIFINDRGTTELSLKHDQRLLLERFLALGFGPSRTVNWRQSKHPQRTTAFDDVLPILRGGMERSTTIKKWLIDLYESSKNEAQSTGNFRSGEQLDKYFELVKDILPGLNIDLGAIQSANDTVTVITPDGEIPIEALSRGIKSVMAWLGVLVRRLYEAYELTEDPTKQYALVLIDEIDAHLHPPLQESLIPQLKEIFPNVQFVASTNSLFMAADVPSDQLIHLTRKQDGSISRS